MICYTIICCAVLVRFGRPLSKGALAQVKCAISNQNLLQYVMLIVFGIAFVLILWHDLLFVLSEISVLRNLQILEHPLETIFSRLYTAEFNFFS